MFDFWFQTVKFFSTNYLVYGLDVIISFLIFNFL